MNKERYISAVGKNISILKEMGVIVPDGYYICPLCMRGFANGSINSALTEEDVPQHSLGGTRITLTCGNCNNRCGDHIDVHLLNAIRVIEQKKFLLGTDRPVVLSDGGKRLNAKLLVGHDRGITLVVNTKHNNPLNWEYFHDNILIPNHTINVADKSIKHDARRISAAILKNAYLLLFAKTGYTFLSDIFYDRLREQIMDPDPFILPERLWTAQNLNLNDGIYLTNDNQYRGFFVVYSLRLRAIYKICVLIPVPNMDYRVACMGLEKIEPNTKISVKPLPYLDYLQDERAVRRLRDWCYGWSMDL